MFSKIWALTDDTVVPGSTMSMQPGIYASFMSAVRGQTATDNWRVTLAQKASYFNAKPSKCLQWICVDNVSFWEISTSALVSASFAPVLAAWVIQCISKQVLRTPEITLTAKLTSFLTSIFSQLPRWHCIQKNIHLIISLIFFPIKLFLMWLFH